MGVRLSVNGPEGGAADRHEGLNVRRRLDCERAVNHPLPCLRHAMTAPLCGWVTCRLPGTPPPRLPGGATSHVIRGLPNVAAARNPRPSPCVYQGEVKTMKDFLVWLIKLPFVLVAIVLAIALGIVGCVLSILGVGLTPVFGVGLVILPIGLILLFAAWLIAKVV